MKKVRIEHALIYDFKQVVKTADKVVIPRFDSSYQYYLLTFRAKDGTTRYSIHEYSKGNHWNISGNHYHYLHDFLTGNFLFMVKGINSDITGKIRLLKEDIEELQQLAIRKPQ
jgi:hypothetical protein